MQTMRVYELIKETFLRKTSIWVVHLIWFGIYGLFWLLFLPSNLEASEFLFIWGGFFLPLALSAGILGDDIASGRICVLVTKPFWSGKLYLYRLLGLSLQGAVHFALAGVLVLMLHVITGKSTMAGVGRWLLSTWLLFNTFAALSTSLSVVVKRTHNALLLFVATLTLFVVASMLLYSLQGHVLEPIVTGFFRYPFPPLELLHNMGKGDYAKETLTVGNWQVGTSVACVAHSMLLTAVYGGVGVLLLTRREFLSQRE
jgi:ABC-type transport system involved in multi-copper enzyme maturation permease subunit